MASYSASNVCALWARGIPGRTATIWTDGKNLYSYDLRIGYTGKDGIKKVYNYTARDIKTPYGKVIPHQFISTTTSRHVSEALKWGDPVKPKKL